MISESIEVGVVGKKADERTLCSHEPDMVAEALDQTLQDLGLDYLDLYLMHWPVASSGGKNTIRYVDVRNYCNLQYKITRLLILSPPDMARNVRPPPHPQSPSNWHLQFLPTPTPPPPVHLPHQTLRPPIRIPPLPTTNLVVEISPIPQHHGNRLLPPREPQSHLRLPGKQQGYTAVTVAE